MLKLKHVLKVMLFVSLNFYAQTNIYNSGYFSFILSDSSKMIGAIVYEDESVFQIKSLSGDEVRINKEKVLSKTVYNKEVLPDSNKTKTKWVDDLTRNKLFFASTAKNLKAGAGTIRVVDFLNPSASIGITDWLSFDASFLYLPFHDNYLNLSLQGNIFSSENSDIALGIINSFTTKDRTIKIWRGYFFGVYTLSNDEVLLNVGATILPSEGDFGISGVDSYIFFAGGEIRIFNKVKFITDNWISSNGNRLVSIGARMISENYHFDLGVFNFSYEENSIAESEKVYTEGFTFLIGLGYNFQF